MDTQDIKNEKHTENLNLIRFILDNDVDLKEHIMTDNNMTDNNIKEFLLNTVIDQNNNQHGQRKRKPKTKSNQTKASTYKKTSLTSVGKDGIKRVVYVKDNIKYVKKKSNKTGKFSYIKV
jgi:hypothetical protein